MRSVYYFIRLGRPIFLGGGFMFFGLGAVMALSAGASMNLSTLLWGQIAVTAIQFMTHYSNDYFDLAADRQNPHPLRWTGGSRVLVKGVIRPEVALFTALGLAAVALLAGLWLVLVIGSGSYTLPLLLLAITLGWSYSAPPLKLNQRGLGELTGAVLTTGLTPLFGYYLQAGRIDLLPFLAVFPLCCWQFAVLLTLNFPDAEGDLAAGKHTLIYYLGQPRAVRLYLIILALLYGSLPFLVLLGLPPLVAAAVLAVLPFIAWQGWRMARGAWRDPQQWDSLSFWGFGLLVILTLAELTAFLALWLHPTS
jgi:1,4-dihydroxy-2-naphthoate octaprenyltransferase